MKRKIYGFDDGMSDIRKMLPEIRQALEENAGDKIYAFVFFEDRIDKTVLTSQTETVTQSYDRGIILRIFAGDRNFEYSTNILDTGFLIDKAKALRIKALEYLSNKKIKNAYTPKKWEEENINSLHHFMKNQMPEEVDEKTWVDFGTPYDEDNRMNFNISRMASYARDTRNMLLEISKGCLSQARVRLKQDIRTKIFIDRYKNMSQTLLVSNIFFSAVTPKGIDSVLSRGGLCGFELGDDISSKDLEELVELAVRLDNAEHLVPGRYKIITGPDVTGVIAHEAFGHTQEGDTCRLGRSCAPGLKKNGVKVGNDMATIINNAALFDMGGLGYGQNGSHFFDDEGQLARPQIILDKGYLSTPMNDLLNSQLGDMNGPAPCQSNGKRESWRRPLIPRQTNTYFTPGDGTKEELIKMVDYGFVAEYAYGGMEDPKGMGLTAGTRFLEEIKDGKLTGRIFLGPKGGHIELSDPVPLLLNGIIAKSRVIDENDTDNQPEPVNKFGGCGKYHKEAVMAGCGGPWILWQGINCG